ncbi:MAG: inorganic diphosphatase [Candidatus Marsarchaeota archaeon]|nr:inorganic diphosphatase [Candidatus Marsarchaeota archaeon]MCL5095060.1 inorganic diphosphatase [Candidatus Marsarchaeota archaeon]
MKINYGKNAPDSVNVFIEIPLGSNIKYEFDEEQEVLRVDRILYTSMVYPFNYGFVPNTKSEDGDPIDVLVISNQPFVPGTIIEVRPIGIAHMEDEEGVDEKVIAVPKDKVDPLFSNIRDITDVQDAIKNKIIHFFAHYKELEPNKWVKITDFGDVKEAKEKIQKAISNK